jgi:hypothetical protein
MNELINMLLKDNSFSVKSADTLRKELEAEMKKDNPDIALINELVLAISEAENYSQADIDIENEFRKVKTYKRKKPVLSYIKGFVAAACAVFVVSNVISYSAYGENLYTLVLKNDDKIHFDFFKSDDKTRDSFKYDSYGVKKFYECLGMNIESPMYFPEGFEITEKRHSEHLVTLSDGKGQVDISFMSLSRGLTIDGVNPNESVIYVNGHIATYINDENADWLIYKFDDIVAIYDFQYLSDEEIDKIISSIE